MLPEARRDVLVQEVGDEVVIYDREWDRLHRLNPTAALIWRHCDGKTTVTELAELLHHELNLPLDEELAWLSLDRLEDAHLLSSRLTPPTEITGVSRRLVMQRLGLAGGATLLLPVVTSLLAACEDDAAGPLGVQPDRTLHPAGPREECAAQGTTQKVIRQDVSRIDAETTAIEILSKQCDGICRPKSGWFVCRDCVRDEPTIARGRRVTECGCERQVIVIVRQTCKCRCA